MIGRLLQRAYVLPAPGAAETARNGAPLAIRPDNATRTNRNRVASHRNGYRGMVLVVVLIVVMMVALAGYRFAEYMVIENQAVQQYGEALQARHAVGSGEELLHVFLEQSRDARQASGGAFDNRRLFRGVLVFQDPRARLRCRFSVISPLVQEGQQASIRFGLENESARLNLAVLASWDQHAPGSARQALLSLPGMTAEIADAILDWIDVDTVAREYGVEDDYYAGMTPPYPPRNGCPETLEELLLVRDVTRELLFGEGSGAERFGDEMEQPVLPRAGRLPDAGGEPPPAWASLLTLHSAERNADSQGAPRVYLNDARLAILHQRLTTALDPKWADFIVAYRQYGPYEGTLAPDPSQSFQLDVAVPGQFMIMSILDLLGAKVQVLPVQVPGQSERPAMVLSSPLADDPAKMREELPRLMDRLSITRATVISGRVNVNLAPESVLRAVPGLDETTVARIVTSRTGVDDVAEHPEREHATWLLSEGIVGLDLMKRLMPYVTAGGDVFRGQVVGFFDTPGPTAREEVVIDAAHHPPRLVHRKDLGQFGLSCSRALLGAKGADQTLYHRAAAGPAL